MSGEGIRRDRRLIFALGCLLGLVLGVSIVYLLLRHDVGTRLLVGIPEPPSNATTTNATANVVDSDPEHSLRLIQAIGILLPLFTGLLRLTTSKQSGVSENLNTELLFGIMTLVLGGTVTVGGLIATDTPVVLKLSLFFVLLTFGIIGVAAVRIFTETTGREESKRPHPETDEQKVREPSSNRIRSLLARFGRSSERLGSPDSDTDHESPEGETDSDTTSEDETTENPTDDE